MFFLTTAKEVPANELLNAIMEDIISGMSMLIYNDLTAYQKVRMGHGIWVNLPIDKAS